VINHDAPNQVIRYFIISVNNPVAGSNNFLSIANFEIAVLLTYPVNSFSNNFQISFDRSLCFDVRNILIKNPLPIVIVAVNLIYRLQNVIQPGFYVVIHKSIVLKRQWIV
jgi:hypothetical protein